MGTFREKQSAKHSRDETRHGSRLAFFASFTEFEVR